MDNVQVQVAISVVCEKNWSDKVTIAKAEHGLQGSMDPGQIPDEISRLTDLVQREALRQVGISREIKRLEEAKRITAEPAVGAG